MKTKPKFKTRRCGCGACIDPALPPMEGCEACHRIAVQRAKQAADEVTR